jgi:molecular chaperone DnaK
LTHQARRAVAETRTVDRDLVLGVDLGTSCSSAAVYDDGELQLAVDDGDASVPSAVHASRTGLLTAGREALRAAEGDAEGLVTSVGRLLGGPPANVRGKQLSPVALAAAVLRRLARLAEDRVGGGVARAAVLAVPVARNGDRAADLAHAAQLAGLDVVEMVAGPIAGVMAYGVPHGGERRIAVVDHGAGAFTATLVEQRGMRFGLRGSASDAAAGGDAFDLALAGAVDALAAAERWSLRGDARNWRRLVARCEGAKRQLSVGTSAYLHLPNAWPGDAALELVLERRWSDDVLRPLAARAAGVMREALARAGWEARSIDRVVLLGGMTQVPVVLEELSDVLERMLVASPLAPLAIARGAALLATRHHGAVRAAV